MSDVKAPKFLPGEVEELLGRMYECCDLQRAIESGQLKTIEQVLEAVKAGADAIEKRLGKAGVFEGSMRLLTQEEISARVRQAEQCMFLAALDVSTLTQH